MVDVAVIRSVALSLCLVCAGAALIPAPARAQVQVDSLAFHEGVAAFEAGQYLQAIERLNAFTERSPETAEANYYLARCYTALGDEPNATRSINRAIDQDKTNLLYREWQHRIGSRAFRIIQKARERDMLRDMLRIDPDNAYANTAVASEQVLIYQHHRNRIRMPDLTPFESPLETNREEFRRITDDDNDIPENPGPPPTQNPFNIEEMRQRGYIVQDLSTRADSAFVAAGDRLTGVLDREPGYREAYRPLMALLSAAGDAHAMKYWATGMRMQFEDDYEPLLYVGYAAHQLKQDEEAEAAFREALRLMPEDERAVYEDVHRVMNDAGESLAAADEAFSADRFWARRDPRYLTPSNERMLEHYSRLVYADLQFGEEKLDLRGWDSDRGKVYVRYGAPTAMYYMSNVIASCSGRLTSGNLGSISNFHIFEYPEYRFVFGNAGNYGDAQNVILPPLNEFTLYVPCSEAFNAMRSTAADFDYVIKTRNTIRETPEAYTYEPAGRKVFFPISRVLSSDRAGADLYVAYGIPLAVGPRQEALRLNMEAGAFLLAGDEGPISEQRVQIEEVPGSDVRVFDDGTLWVGALAMQAPAGEHVLAVEFESTAQRALGFERAEIDIPHFETNAFEVSDIQLAYLAEESDAGTGDPRTSFERNGYRIYPAPWGVFGIEQPLYIYFEMYNLRSSPQGQTRYQVEALLIEKRQEGRLKDVFRRAFRRGGTSEGVAVKFEGAGSSVDDGQYFILDASAQPPGVYVLALHVTDLESGKTIERIRTVMLE